MRKERRGREKVREPGGLVLAALLEAAAWSLSGPVKYVREYERPSICRLSVRLPTSVTPPQKLAVEGAFSGNPRTDYPLPPSPFLSRFNLTRIGLPCTHPRNHSYGFTSVVDNRARLSRNFRTAPTCFSLPPSQSRGRVLHGNLGQRYGNLVQGGRLRKSTPLAAILACKNLNGSLVCAIGLWVDYNLRVS